MGLDLSLLETFTLVADLGSFSAAARKRGITQPAVSFQIKTLEKELGAPLIDRSHHGKLSLTPAGRTAYWHAVKILEDRESMMLDIPRTTGEVSGRLLLFASTIPGEYILPHTISVFQKAYQGVRVCLDISDSADVVEGLKQEKAELGFVGNRVQEPGIAERKFAEDRLVLITPKGHPLSGKRTVKLDSLAGERFIERLPGSGTRLRMEVTLASQGYPVNELDVVAEVGSTQAVISSVQAGIGIAIVSNRAAEQPASQGIISMKDLTGVDLSREFFMINLKERPISLAAEKFSEFVMDEVR